MLDFAVKDVPTQDTLVLRRWSNKTPWMGRVSPHSRMTIVSSTHLSPGKRKGITAKAREAMSMNLRKGCRGAGMDPVDCFLGRESHC